MSAIVSAVDSALKFTIEATNFSAYNLSFVSAIYEALWSALWSANRSTLFAAIFLPYGSAIKYSDHSTFISTITKPLKPTIDAANKSTL